MSETLEGKAVTHLYRKHPLSMAISLALLAAMSHASYDAASRKEHGISDGLIRLSVGLEAFADLRDDLNAAWAKVLDFEP